MFLLYMINIGGIYRNKAEFFYLERVVNKIYLIFSGSVCSR